MFVVEDEVLLKALDESPRFRYDYIQKTILNSNDFVVLIINQYDLKLVNDIYVKKVNIEAYNSKKRAKLKEQEIILIKKLKVFDKLQKHMNELVQEVEDIDVSFTTYFENDYHQLMDHDFSYKIIFQFIDKYFAEYEARNRNE